MIDTRDPRTFRTTASLRAAVRGVLADAAEGEAHDLPAALAQIAYCTDTHVVEASAMGDDEPLAAELEALTAAYASGELSLPNLVLRVSLAAYAR